MCVRVCGCVCVCVCVRECVCVCVCVSTRSKPKAHECVFEPRPALPSLQKEKKVKKKAEEGESVVLKCNPPPSSMEPIIHWMDLSESLLLTPALR